MIKQVTWQSSCDRGYSDDGNDTIWNARDVFSIVYTLQSFVNVWTFGLLHYYFISVLATTSQPPLSNVWLQTCNMTVPRHLHGSIYIPETGNVLLAGTDGGSLSMELFVSSNWTFAKRRNMSQMRQTLSMDRLTANSILIAGGTNADVVPIDSHC